MCFYSRVSTISGEKNLTQKVKVSNCIILTGGCPKIKVVVCMFVDVLIILFHALMEKSCTIIPRHDNPTYRSISATSATPVWLMCLRIPLSYLPLSILSTDYSTFTRNDSQTIKNSGALFENVGAALLLPQHFSSYSSILTINLYPGCEDVTII